MSQLPIPAFLDDELERVDTIIRERMAAQPIVMRAAGSYLLPLHGKRLQAAMTLLAARLLGTSDTRVLHAAACVELIHTASRVHDDLLDAVEKQNGAQRHRWSGDVALMVGDYVFALAAGEMALAPDPRIIDYFSRAVMAICEGELSPVTVVRPLHEAIEQYYFVIGSKTATLFEAGCRAGMVCGSGSPDQVEALGRFGYDYGLAYQIIADIADVAGPTALPKRHGGNGRSGAITLPLIYAVEASGDQGLAERVEQRARADADLAQDITAIRNAGGIDRAMADAARLIDQAIGYLAPLPDSAAKTALIELARAVLE